MKPWHLVPAFLVGLVLGLVFANEEHANSDAWSTLQLVELRTRFEACAAANAEWQKVATVQGGVLERQQAALRQVGPIVRRAYPLWPWVEDSGVPQPEVSR